MSPPLPETPVGNGERLRVVVVDDHHLFRAGVRAELADACDVVGEASGPAEAVDVILESGPDVVLLDVHLPDGGGVAVLEGLGLAGVSPPVLALSVSDSAEDVVPMIRAGALGSVTKTIELGDAYFSPRLAAFVLQAFSDRAPREVTVPGLEDLTPREREVLHHLARGYAYKQIGARLGISARTVESHVGAVLRKLQLTSRHQVTHWAVSRGLLMPEDDDRPE
jgi:DNA-binding NarL/FixJ family response regulator